MEKCVKFKSRKRISSIKIMWSKAGNGQRPAYMIAGLALLFVASVAHGFDAGNTSGGRGLLRRLIYDDSYMTRFLDDRLPYLKTVDEKTNETIGYVGVRDYFNLSKVFWPDEEYIESKNIEQLLYEELKAIDVVSGIFFTDDMWQYSNEAELRESGGPEADESQCGRDLQYLSGELQKANEDAGYLYEPGRRNIELLRWIDAWGRPPSETHWGNTFWQGSYRACKTASVPEEDGGKEIRFNYCWAKLLAKDWPQKDVLIPKVSIRSGVCLPRSCDTILARKHKALLRDMMQFNFSPMQRERFLNRSIDDLYCLPLKRPNVPQGERWSRESSWFLWATGAWLLLILGSSVWFACSEAKPRKRKGTIRACFECLAIQKNWKQLLDDNKPPESYRVDLRALGLVKLVSCLLVAFAHCFEFLYWYFYSSSIHLLETRRLHYLSMTWFTKSVDIFFIVSGTLTAYTLLAKFPPDKLGLIIKPKVYLLINVARYLKLAPVLIYGFAFMKTVFVQLAEGPYWDYATYSLSHQGRCQRLSWWRQLIWPIIFDFGAKGGDPHACECMPSSWYIVTDMKMFLVVPFYFYALYRYKPLRLHLLFATMVVSTMWNYAHMSMQNLIYYRQYFQYGMMHATSITIGYFETSYFSAINRFYSLAFGLFAGIHLYRFKMGKINKWPSYMRGLATWAVVLWQVYDLFFRAILAEISYRQTGQTPSEEHMKWMTLFKQRIDTLTIVIFTLRLATDWSKPLMKNANFCFKLSKLSYCVYIVHTLLIHYTLTASEHSRPNSEPLQLLMFSAFIITSSFIIALPLHLFIESPLALLLNQALNKAKYARTGSKLYNSPDDLRQRSNKDDNYDCGDDEEEEDEARLSVLQSEKDK